MIQLACGAIGWMTNLSETARKIRAIGFSGLEGFGLLELVPEDAVLPGLLERLNLTYVGSYFGGSFVEPGKLVRELEDFRETCRITASWGGRKIAVGGGRLFPTSNRSDDWRHLVDALRQLAQVSGEFDVELCFHPHHGTLVFDEDQIEKLMNETPTEVGLTLDSGHLAFAKCDIVRVFRRFRNRLKHVHLKDFDGQYFCELGRGKAPLKDLMKWLKCEYNDWIIVELDSSNDAEASAKANFEFAQTHLN